MARTLMLAISLVALFPQASAETCGGYPKTNCPDSHLCCAIDSGDDAGFCCPRSSRIGMGAEVQCAFFIDGLGIGVQRVRNCCEGHPVCGVGVGARYCCMGPRSKLSPEGCAAHGPPVCCNKMCGDDLCDAECEYLGGTCTAGAASEGGKCVRPATGEPISPPLV
mmetsp:Transcript_119685/g.343836  ORF Transcript_119685/g.343836 Transcript_119685/m.343836 type:complete len:165 (+) Transcript_119685:107-601(+)